MGHVHNFSYVQVRVSKGKKSCWPKADSRRNYAEVMSVQQKKIKISAQTLCIHGDGPPALDYAKKSL
ncbi:LamB/YcsF family protein [Lysinibacillus xylanilyticus]|uniref:LamB/YcsF family protein n=1 Tax=Lysinibacillus xylanilyticus TaxID=582475 RepID=UPI003814C2C8